MIVNIGILTVLILLNGFLSLSEIAIVSVNVNKLKLLAEQGDKKAAMIKKIKENTGNFFSAIQIGVSLLSLLTGAYTASAFVAPITQKLSQTFQNYPVGAEPAVVLATTVVISYFMLVFGELVPKRLGVSKALEISRGIAGVINALSVCLTPFTKILTFSTDLFFKIFKINEKNDDDDVTEEEIRMLVESSGETGGIDESELEMINNVFEFDDKTAGEILTHRTKLVAIPIKADKQTLFNAVLNEGFSRIPVYKGNVDHITGILYTHDLLEYIVKTNEIGDVDLESIIRKPFFVPKSKKTDELFKYMQKAKLHMSVVVDEYGGTLGIVTMEDLIEEIMGNIQDEYDEEDELNGIEPITSGLYLINGSLDLADVADFFKTALPESEYDTVSGFFIGVLGRIPAAAEKPEIIYGDLVFKAYETEEKRVKSLLALSLKKEGA